MSLIMVAVAFALIFTSDPSRVEVAFFLLIFAIVFEVAMLANHLRTDRAIRQIKGE